MHGFATITHRGDQVVSGMAINILAAGLTVTLGRYWFDQGGQTPALSGAARFAPIDLPYAKELYDVPVVGQLYSELLSGHPCWSTWRSPPCRWPGGCCSVPASACACGRWARRRQRSTPPVSRWCACATPRSSSAACWPASAAPTWRWPQTAQFIPNMSAGKGLHGAGGAGVRQVAPLERHGGLPAVRLPRCGRHPAARGQHRRFPDPGASHRGAALHPDRVPAGRLHRQGGGT